MGYYIERYKGAPINAIAVPKRDTVLGIKRTDENRFVSYQNPQVKK